MTDFAKIFDTKHGQILAFLSEAPDGSPEITVIGHGGLVRVKLAGWPDKEVGQAAAFAKMSEYGAAETLANQIEAIAKGAIAA